MGRLFQILFIFAALTCQYTGAEAKDFVLVIDAGHGGHDYGAVGDKTNEKSINLSVALKFGRLVKQHHKDVKVVYTRDGDYFKTLQQRAEIANKASGDLFVSIHTNSVDKRNKNRRKIKGTATYTLGLHRSAENLDVAKRENAVMMLEDDFTATYQGFDPNSTESYIIFELSQNKHMDQSIDFASKVQSEMVSTAGRHDNGVRQAGFWVLAKTGMPAVLVELDFICNPVSERFLGSEKGQTKFAKAIYNAFTSYKTAYDHSSGGRQVSGGDAPLLTDDDSDDEDDDMTDDIACNDGELRYRIQILASDVKLKSGSSQFKGLNNVDNYYDGGLYKYTVGDYTSMDEALRELKKVRSKHREAFVITMRDGKRVK